MTVVLLCRILWNRKHTEKKAQKRKRWENKAGRFKTVQTIFVTERTRKLNMYLEGFIPSIWRKDREDYEPLSLRSFVSSVDRCFVDFHQRQFTWFTSFMIDLWELNLNLMNKWCHLQELNLRMYIIDTLHQSLPIWYLRSRRFESEISLVRFPILPSHA